MNYFKVKFNFTLHLLNAVLLVNSNQHQTNFLLQIDSDHLTETSSHPFPMIILFFEEDERVRLGLKQALDSLNLGWDVEFANSGAKVFSLMSKKTIDLIISHRIRLGMSGTVLLNQVKDIFPGTVRFILAGHDPGENIFQSIISSDYYFSKASNQGDLNSEFQINAEIEQSLIKLHQNLNVQPLIIR